MSPFLPLGIALAVLLLGVGLLARAALLGYPRPSFAARVLSRPEQAIVAATADALFPCDGPIPLSGTQAGLVRYMDDRLAQMQPSARVLVRLLFLFVEHGGWLFGPRHARFTRMTGPERVAALRGMQSSRIYLRRVAFFSLRMLLSIGYLANDEVAGTIGLTFRAAPFDEPRPSSPPRARLSGAPT